MGFWDWGKGHDVDLLHGKQAGQASQLCCLVPLRSTDSMVTGTMFALFARLFALIQSRCRHRWRDSKVNIERKSDTNIDPSSANAWTGEVFTIPLLLNRPSLMF